MNCFEHQNEVAIGICKHCTKAVCSECAIDTGEGLACSELCVEEVKAYNSMMGRAKHLYGMGPDGQKLPVTIIMFILFGIIIGGTGVYRSITYTEVDYISLLMGATFLLVAFLFYKRNKKVGISI